MLCLACIMVAVLCVCCVGALSRVAPMQRGSRFGAVTAHRLTAGCASIVAQWRRGAERGTR